MPINKIRLIRGLTLSIIINKRLIIFRFNLLTFVFRIFINKDVRYK